MHKDSQSEINNKRESNKYSEFLYDFTQIQVGESSEDENNYGENGESEEESSSDIQETEAFQLKSKNKPKTYNPYKVTQ